MEGVRESRNDARSKELIVVDGVDSRITELGKSVLGHEEGLNAPKEVAIERLGLGLEETLRAKNGEMWECIGREKGKHGGWVYVMAIRQEYDYVVCRGELECDRREESYRKKNGEIYPAVEPPPKLALKFLNGQQLKGYRYAAVLRDHLGYRAKIDLKSMRYVMCLPDHEALSASWQELQKTNPRLPDLKLLTSDGVADDLSFVKAFIDGYVLLATGKEFIHDHSAHVMSTLLLMLSSGNLDLETSKRNPTYEKERARLQGVVKEGYDLILAAEKRSGKLLKEHRKLLGAFTDIISSIGAYIGEAGTEQIREGQTLDQYIAMLFDGDEWRDIFKAQFPGWEKPVLFSELKQS